MTSASKQALFEQLAVIARALGNAARLELLDFLAQGERNVEELASATGLSIANTSKHLQQLKAASLVEARRDGKYIRYRLSDDRILDAIGDIRVLAEAHLDAVDELLDQYLRSRDHLEPLPAVEWEVDAIHLIHSILEPGHTEYVRLGSSTL